MKNIVGVLAITSVFTAGIYFYLNTGGVQTTNDGSPAAATVSEPIKAQSFEAQKPDQKSQEVVKKPVPELKSFEGLDEESNVIFNGDGGSQSPSEDPLNSAAQ